MKGLSRGGASADATRDRVRERYGAIAEQRGCCGAEAATACCGGATDQQAERLGYAARELEGVPEGSNLGLGCGNPTGLLALLPGQVVLDLGSGAGVDCFLASKKVGRKGRVIGVDMTPSMISRARENARRGRYPNVEFRLGEIEHLPVADASVDVVISNCVINLAPDKADVYREAFRVLRPGGRLAVSDVVTTRSISVQDRSDTALWSGCSSGALTPSRITTLLRRAGFRDVRVKIRVPDRVPGSLQEEASIGVYPADIQASRGGRTRP